ncbi:carbohydrate ABC transporter permease [Cohnella endophytica]|uniref:Carbohydrate ABC transporter permease n=1 Tax=Cohnella endophytica TaxID=2419778 RepID=A0A494Y7K7_9BACL|nr:carbohydrate ABC transporter permease [Cohnella endophytica]RKP56298.1 carbohydrate ABC transporter permease [Cohnella endophytica]
MRAGRSTFFIRMILLVSVVLYAIPLYLSIVNIFKTTDQITLNPFAIPSSLNLDNLTYVLNNPNVHLYKMYLNTLIIAVSATLLTLLFTAMAAFYTSRSSGKLSGILHVYFIMGIMVPYAIVYIPLVIIFRDFHLIGTLHGLILVFISGNIPFAFFMYHGFMKTAPRELEESAAIDGAGQFRTFWQIIFPLLKPCTTTTAIFIGLSMWNDFLTPLLIGQVHTITLGIYTAIGPHSTNWGQMFAFVFFGTFPVVVAYLFAQKQFVSGLTAGALKG